jgi:phage terminase large subunit GpA-like protein
VAIDLRKSFAIIKPPERLRISEWAREHARLKDGSRYYPWPFQIEMLDILNHPLTRKVTVQKSTRVGYTQILLAYMGYRLAHEPGNLIMARPTIEDSKAFMKEHVAAMLGWDVFKELAAAEAASSRKSATDTTLEKFVPGGSLKAIGANSPGGFRDKDGDAIISDEVDGWPVSAGDEGDQLMLFAERLMQAFDPKDIAGSTPTDELISKIHPRFLESDQRYYHVPCEHCGAKQKLVWGSGEDDKPGLRWFPFKDPTEYWYQCVNGCRMQESSKLWALQNGLWIPENPDAYTKHGHAGFHVHALYSLQPGAEWPLLARKFLETYKSPVKHKTFINTTLGDVWRVKGDVPDWQRLSDRREEWKKGWVPYGGCVLTCGIDVQGAGIGRIECFVIAHGRGGQRWLVDHHEVEGDPFVRKTWDKMETFVRSKFPHENGTSMMTIERGAVDMGYATRAAYQFCLRMGLDWMIPVKGSPNLNAPPISASQAMELQHRSNKQTKNENVRVHLIGGHGLKLELYHDLALDKPDPNAEEPEHRRYPDGYVHLPTWLDLGTLKELVSEQWIAEKSEWKPTGPNEFMDCMNYAKAALIHRGAERWTEDEWDRLEAVYGLPGAVTLEEESPSVSQKPDEEDALAEAPAATTQKRKKPKSSWLYGGER